VAELELVRFMDASHLYREVGEALHIAQTLETNISALIAILNERFDAQIDERQIILSDDRRTLGQLIHALKKHGELGGEGADILKEALDARNYITHHFFMRNIYAFSSEVAHIAALAALNEHTKQIAAAAAMTSGFVQAFSEHFNIKLSDILVRQDT
jgi:hypothetical protein